MAKKSCCGKCGCGKQVTIGDNGEVVTISLTEYEGLIETASLLNNLYKTYNDTKEENNKN